MSFTYQICYACGQWIRQPINDDTKKVKCSHCGKENKIDKGSF